MYQPTELCKLALKYGADKCPAIAHLYTPYYYEYFKDRRQSIKKVFEMGIGNWGQKRMVDRLCADIPSFEGYVTGPSLRMWRDFFPNARIYGADKCAGSLFTDDRIETYCCNENKDEDLEKLVSNMGSDVDLVIDDGSHRGADQIHLCRTLMPMLKAEVVYFIEDCKNVKQVCAALSQYDCSVIELEGEGAVSHDHLILVRKKHE